MARKSLEELKEKGRKKQAKRAERFARKAARKGMTTDQLRKKREDLWGKDIADRQAGVGGAQGQEYAKKFKDMAKDESVEDAAKSIKSAVSFKPKSGNGFRLPDASPLDRTDMLTNADDIRKKKTGRGGYMRMFM